MRLSQSIHNGIMEPTFGIPVATAARYGSRNVYSVSYDHRSFTFSIRRAEQPGQRETEVALGRISSVRGLADRGRDFVLRCRQLEFMGKQSRASRD